MPQPTLLIDTLTYDGFGVVTSESNTTTTGDRYKFTGRELDSESGLQLNGERFYDPKVGRWLSQDPLGLVPDPNLYRYVRNNATDATDPSGLQDTKPAQGPNRLEITFPGQGQYNRPMVGDNGAVFWPICGGLTTLR